MQLVGADSEASGPRVAEGMIKLGYLTIRAVFMQYILNELYYAFSFTCAST